MTLHPTLLLAIANSDLFLAQKAEASSARAVQTAGSARSLVKARLAWRKAYDRLAEARKAYEVAQKAVSALDKIEG